MSIKEITKKIKCLPSEKRDVLITIILILTTLGSFGLGRLSKIEETKSPVRIDNMAASVVQSTQEQTRTAQKGQPKSPQGGGFYVASKNGTKYHFPWCSGAKRIKEGNKRVFNTKEDAEKAGYSPASNCKGL